MMIKNGSYVRWTGDDGAFSYVGKVVGDDGSTYSVDTEYGIMGIPHDDGRLEQIKKPKGFTSNVISVTPVADEKPKRKKREKGSPTKYDQALQLTRDLYGKGHGKDTTVQRIMDVLEMSKAGATTYFYKAKKEIGG